MLFTCVEYCTGINFIIVNVYSYIKADLVVYDNFIAALKAFSAQLSLEKQLILKEYTRI
jgi:hypothetical protein